MARKTKRVRTVRESVPKPTLLIDSKTLRGNSFKVGKRATVKVTGKVVEESIREYEAKGRKCYRVEVDKVTAIKKTSTRKSKRR